MHRLFHRKKNQKKQRGFTLVELIIYMGMLIILLTVLTSIFSQAIDTQLETQATSSVEQDGRYIVSKLVYDINRASSIVSPALGATNSASLQIVISGVTTSYGLSNGNLVATASGTTTNLNGYDTTISNLSFQQFGNSGGQNTIQVKFTTTSKTTRPKIGKEVRDYQTTAGIRY